MGTSKGLSYTDMGKGPVLILIHGFCESKKIWEKFQHELSLDYRVICIDLPGFGASPLLVEKTSMEYYADAIYETLPDLGTGKFVMAGHSLGGYVMLAFAEKYPELIKGLALFHSSALADKDDRKANRNKTIEFIRKHGSRAFAPTLIPTLFTEASKIRFRVIVETLTEVAAQTSEASIIAASEAMRDRPDRTIVLKNTTRPVLFIIGKEDMAIPLETSLQQCHIPSQSLAYFLADAAHMGMFEKEQETLEIMRDFVDLCQK